MKRFILIIPVLIGLVSFAQQQGKEVSFAIGSWVTITKCKSKAASFEHMDLYTKTRYPETGIKIDTLTGDGIFENFFAPGDFDAKRLPCEYGGKKYRIAALRVFEVEGKEKRVMVLYTKNKLSLIWVEFDNAIHSGEVFQ